MNRIEPALDRTELRSLRLRVAMLLAGAFALIVCFGAVYRGVNTVIYLDRIEAERDRWQRPAAIVDALNIRPGAVVADLGCGSGYFTLKLSSVVGNNGQVVAIDIRRFPLAFLQLRAWLRNRRNITAVRGDKDDPRLTSGSVNAVLVVNTYHELQNRTILFAQVFSALVPAGRLVIVDRQEASQPRSKGGHIHDIGPEKVDQELRHLGYELVSRADHFVQDPEGGDWWLMVMRR